MHSVGTFQPYVFGRKLTVITNHQPLIRFKTADLNTRAQKWRFKVSKYDYDIIYEPGRMNEDADALSRNPVDFHQINLLTRKQVAMKKGFEEKKEEDKRDTKFNASEPPITEISKETRRKRSNKKIV